LKILPISHKAEPIASGILSVRQRIIKLAFLFLQERQLHPTSYHLEHP